MDEQGLGDSIEFQEIDNDSLLTTVARQSFRVPVTKRTDFSLVVDEKSYSLANISAGGIAVSMDSEAYFVLGQILPDCELILPGKIVKGLKGEVVHCSSYIAGKWLYGIKWINIDPDASKKIDSAILMVRKGLFENNQLKT